MLVTMMGTVLLQSRFLNLGACVRVVVVMCVYVSVYLSVTALVATYLVYMSKVKWRTVSCNLLKIWVLDFAENISFGRYGIVCHNDR